MRRFSVVLAIGLVLSGCPDDGTGPGADAGVSESAGVVREGGEESAYRMNVADSQFVIIVPKENATGCTVFHSHAIEATTIGLEFVVDYDDPGASSITANIAAAGLMPDDNALRAQFEETNDVDLSDSDRSTIRAGMLSEQLDAPDFPTLTFSAANISGVDGTGLTADVTATIKDTDSTFGLSFDATRDGDTITIEGEGTLDGSAHGMPAGFGSNCIQSDFRVVLKLVLEPGEQAAGVDAGVVEEYVPETFPYEGACDDDVGFPEASQALLKNCAGCHKDTPILGATVPLVDYDDWRTDSLRNQGRPLYETAAELMQLHVAEALHMPPSSTSPIDADDLSLALLWFERGAPDAKCEPDIIEGFIPRDPLPCGSPNYNDDIKPILSVNCEYCHYTGGNPDVPPLDSYAAGLLDASHPFYQPVSLWEASVHRIADRTMPPYGSAGDYYPAPPATFESDVQMLTTWIENGYPEEACP